MDSLVDSNNNSDTKKYSLRPRTGGKKSSEVISIEESRKPRSRTKKRLSERNHHLSKYRRKSANARERSRMREINEAFETLRRVVTVGDDVQGEKMTKISTLRLAMRYITSLSEVLEQSAPVDSAPSSSRGLQCKDQDRLTNNKMPSNVAYMSSSTPSSSTSFRSGYLKPLSRVITESDNYLKEFIESSNICVKSSDSENSCDQFITLSTLTGFLPSTHRPKTTLLSSLTHESIKDSGQFLMNKSNFQSINLNKSPFNDGNLILTTPGSGKRSFNNGNVSTHNGLRHILEPSFSISSPSYGSPPDLEVYPHLFSLETEHSQPQTLSFEELLIT